MRDVSRTEADGDIIDTFSVPVSSSNGKDRKIIVGNEGRANITLGYTLSCIDSNSCQPPINTCTPTSEGKIYC